MNFQVLKTADYGVFTTKYIAKGDFICEYDGELLTEVEGEQRRDEYKDKEASFVYFFEHNGYKLW